MKARSIILVILLLHFFVPGLADTETGKLQTHCPICKTEIDNRLFVDYAGKRIYLGSTSCASLFRENPEEYVRQLNAAGIQLTNTPSGSNPKRIQLYCVCGNDHLDDSLFTDVSSKRVFFCTRKCSDHFNRSPEKNLRKLQKKGMKFQINPKADKTDS